MPEPRITPTPPTGGATRQPREAQVQASGRPPARRMTSRDLGLVAAFAGLIVVLGLPGAIPPIIGTVPITLQTLGVMLAGALLGWRRGGAAVLVVIALCAFGLPVLAGGRGGLAVFAGPSAGYLVSWPFAAALIGLLVHAHARRHGSIGPVTIFLACLVGGIALVHVCGIPVMMWRGGLDLRSALLADAVFLPGDLIKAVVAAVVSAGVLRAVPDLLPAARTRR